MATLTDKVYTILKEKLFTAEAGVFYSVRKCADELGMSYTPVREALLRLHKEGFLELVPNVGFFVTSLDIDDIISIYQSRECIEHYAFSMVISTLTAKDVMWLREILVEQKRALKKRKLPEFTKLDIDFHIYLIDKLGNRYLSEFYNNIREQHLFCSKSITQSDGESVIQEHSEFLELISRGQYEEAIRQMEQHSGNALERMKDGYIRVRHG